MEKKNSSTKLHELQIPPDVFKHEAAMETVRVWHAGGKQYMILRSGRWEDPAAWGISIVDMIKHIADSYHKASGMDYEQALRRIRQGFDAEWGSPTDKPFGRLLDNESEKKS